MISIGDEPVVLVANPKTPICTQKTYEKIKDSSISVIEFVESWRATKSDFDLIFNAGSCNGGIYSISIGANRARYLGDAEDTVELLSKSEFTKSIKEVKLCFFTNRYMRSVVFKGLFISHDTIIELARILAINSSFLELFSVKEDAHDMSLVEDVISEFVRSKSIKMIGCVPRTVEYTTESLARIYTTAAKIPSLETILFTRNLASIEQCIKQTDASMVSILYQLYLKYNRDYVYYDCTNLNCMQISGAAEEIKPSPAFGCLNIFPQPDWAFRQIGPRRVNNGSTILSDMRICYADQPEKLATMLRNCRSLIFRDIDFTAEKLPELIFACENVRRLCLINCAIENHKDHTDQKHARF